MRNGAGEPKKQKTENMEKIKKKKGAVLGKQKRERLDLCNLLDINDVFSILRIGIDYLRTSCNLAHKSINASLSNYNTKQ